MRLWNLDAWRGCAVLLMIGYHGTWDFYQFTGRVFDAQNPVFAIWRLIIISIFFTVAGISLSLSKEDKRPFLQRTLRRIAQIGGAAVLITIGSAVLFPDHIVWFGVLHFITTAIIIGSILLAYEHITKYLPVLALASIILGLFIERVQGPMYLLPLGIHPAHMLTLDYYPLFPNIGLFLVGMYLGRTHYTHVMTKNKAAPSRTRIQQTPKKTYAPFIFLGRHALLVYVVHLPVLYGLIYAMTQII